jgi:hypothetical protein
MAINRFQTFSNPGQISVDPWQLPFDELNTALASKQMQYDEADAAISEIVMPKAGYITDDLQKAVSDEYSPEITALENSLYETGDVNTNKINQLAKKIAADKRVELINNDYALKGDVDKAMANEQFPNGIQGFYEEGAFNQVDPNNFDGVSLGQKYRFLKPQEYSIYSGDYVDRVVQPVKDQMIAEGKIYEENGVKYINEEKTTYVNGQPVTNTTSEILTEEKNIAIVKDRLNNVGESGTSHAEELFNNITGVPQWNWWFESQKRDLDRDPTVDEFSEMLVNSWKARTYNYQTGKQSTMNLPAGSKGTKSSSDDDDIVNQIDWWTAVGKRSYTNRVASLVETQAKTNGFNVENMPYTEATNFISTLEGTLKTATAALAQPTFNELTSLKNVAVNSINDPNIKAGVSQVISAEQAFNVSVENGKATYTLTDKFLNAAGQAGVTTGDLKSIKANVKNVENAKNAEYQNLKNQTESTTSLMKSVISESGIENVKGFVAKEKEVKANTVSNIIDNQLNQSSMIIANTIKNKVQGKVDGPLAYSTPGGLPGYFSDEDKASIKSILNTKIGENSSGWEGAQNFGVITDENGEIIDIEQIKTIDTPNIDGIGVIHNALVDGAVAKAATNNPKYSATFTTKGFPDVQEKINKNLEDDLEYSRANKMLTDHIKMSTSSYKTEGTIYKFNTFDAADFADPAQKRQISSMQDSALELFNELFKNTHNEDIKMALTDKKLADKVDVLLNELKSGGTIKATGGKPNLEMNFNGKPMAFGMERFSLRYDTGDAQWMLDVNIDEIGIEAHQGASDQPGNIVEIPLDKIQMDNLVKKTNLDMSTLQIRQVQKRMEIELKEYGFTESNNLFNLSDGSTKNYYSTQTFRNNENNSNLKTKFNVGGSSLNLEFSNSYELADFEGSVDEAISRAEYIFSVGNVDEKIINNEVREFSKFLQMENGHNIDAAQADEIAHNSINSMFVNNNYKEGVEQPIYDHPNGKTYLTDPETMQELSSAGIPTNSTSTYSLFKVHPDVIAPLKVITDQFSGLLVTNALRSTEDLAAMADDFDIASNSLHLRGLGVDLAGVPEAQMASILKYLGANMESYGLRNIIHHDGHLHLEFNTFHTDALDKASGFNNQYDTPAGK